MTKHARVLAFVVSSFAISTSASCSGKLDAGPEVDGGVQDLGELPPDGAGPDSSTPTPATLSLTPNSAVTLPTTAVSSTGSQQTFVAANTGGLATPACSQVILSGANADEFAIDGQDACVAGIAPHSQCTFSVRPAPTSVGAKSATFSLQCGALTASASLSYTANIPHYISPSGNDTTGTGEADAPWRSLRKACESVVTAGETIHVNAGTYNETEQCVLAVGVSIEGEGVSSHIFTNYVASSIFEGAIKLDSPAEGTSGDQSISAIMLDGTSLAADNAIVIHGRGNVKIHDVTIVDFYANAVQFNGRVGTWGTPPEIYSTGNELYDSTITNCNTRTASERGLSIGMIAMSGQDGLRIHHNTLTQTSRPMGENGDIVDGVEGHNRRLKFYSNTSVKPDTEGGEWNFHIEHWNSSGGMEVYDNSFLGGNAVDAAGNLTTRGTDEYSWWIHDNVMALRAQLPVFTDPIMCGVDFEGTVEDAIVNDNHFVNLANGVTFSLQYETTHQQNIRIHHNVFENIGYANGDFTAVIAGEVTGAMMVLEDIYIDNNTIVAAATAGKPGSGLLLNAINGSIQRIFFRNNIVDGTGEYSYLSFWNGPGPVSDVHALNNLMFNVASGIAPYTYAGADVTGFESANNLTGAPVFVSETDFSLQSSSPAIDHGTDVGLPFVGTAPDIGAFEYGSSP